MIHKTDTEIQPPKLNNYGGDLSRRWYIDHYTTGERKREWIAARPVNTRQERAEKLLLKFSKAPVYVASDIRPRLYTVISTLEIRERTVSTYKTAVNILADFFLHRRLESLNKNDIDSFIQFLKSKYSNTTVKNNISHLKAITSKIDLKLFEGYKTTYNIQESDFNYPFNDYERRVIDEYLIEQNPRLYILTRFIYYGFIRPKELRLLKVSDIDLMTRSIKVKHTIAKNKRSASVPIIKPLHDLILKEKLTQYPGNYYLFGDGLETCDKLASKNYACSQFRKALKELNLYRPRITVLYSWKPTGNIQGFLAGLDTKTLQLMNRHKSIETTEIYLRKLGLFLDRTVLETSY